MSDSVLLVSESAMVDHDPGPLHPEKPARLRALLEHLRAAPIAHTRWTSPAPAPRELIERIHSSSYVDTVEATRGRTVQLDPDTRTSPASVDVAHLAVGAVFAGVREVVGGSARRAFCLVRPPGHHAERDSAMGFCLFNSVAVAAQHAREQLGCQRVLILDWDVHHGNGTQHAFESRDDILVIDSHQDPLYPGTGALSETGTGAGAGFTVNLPLAEHTEDPDMVAIYRSVVVPIAEQFEPDLILCSAGFDGHVADPLASLDLTETGYAALCGIACDLADRYADGRLLLTLEGGYDVDALIRSVRACIDVLAGQRPPDVAPPTPRGLAAIDQFRRQHGQAWAL